MIKIRDLTKNRLQRKLMPVPIAAGAYLGAAGISALGNLVGGYLTNKANLTAVRETNALQKQMFNEQMNYNLMAESRARNYALEDFDRENAYNHPAAVRARYEAAGLNPALMMQGQNAAVGQIEATNAASSAPAAPQLSPPEYKDYISPAIEQAISALGAFSSIEKTQREAAGVEFDNQFKAASMIDRLTEMRLNNIARAKQIEADPNLDADYKKMMKVNLDKNNQILDDTLAQLTLTFDARSKSQSTVNYLNQSTADKIQEDITKQKIENFFLEDRILLDMRLSKWQIKNFQQSIAESMSREEVNIQTAVKVGLEAAGIDPDTDQGKQYFQKINSEIYKNGLVPTSVGYGIGSTSWYQSGYNAPGVPGDGRGSNPLGGYGLNRLTGDDGKKWVWNPKKKKYDRVNR